MTETAPVAESMSVKEAGAKGGKATMAKYGRSHFVEIGRVSGLKAAAKGREFFVELGKKGGKTTAAKPGHMSKIGKMGGRVTGRAKMIESVAKREASVKREKK